VLLYERRFLNAWLWLRMHAQRAQSCGALARMTNDEIPNDEIPNDEIPNDEIPNDEKNPNDECLNDQEENAAFHACRWPPAFRHSDFVIRHSTFTANVAESRSLF
jgi:hypothetical protein